ncbi:MAG: ABC transporter permease [Gemmatimonadota bacterium]|nr:ABC transporter permease [Gemmatimonadota bacterium]MDE3217068.1 ABC transporter permease [Gemmatimonadota bacterium]
MRMLTRKLVRDVVGQAGPLAAVAMVAASGIALYISLRSMRGFLARSQADYYRDYRFADVFVQVKRAPAAAAREAAAIPGVRVAEPRLLWEAVLDVPGLAEPAVGRFVSIPPAGEPRLNVPHVRVGRMPAPGTGREVAISEAFAEANGLGPGDSLGAVLNGRWERLHVVGVAISPEYIYEMQGTELFPDNRRFGIVWTPRALLASATGLETGFNALAVELAPGASEPDVIAALDRLLGRYGTLGAYGRSEHASHRFISDEIEQNKVGAVILPGILLGVTAFLLNVVLSRLVATQRAQIAVLKAFGFTNAEVGRHYLALALAPVAAGGAVGVPLGFQLASATAAIYARYYRFPVSEVRPDWGVAAAACLIAATAAVVGAALSVRAAVSLPPAEGMRPPAPARFEAGLLDRLGAQRLLAPSTRIVVRNTARRPLRAAAAVAGIALAFAMLVVARYAFTAVDRIKDVQFQYAQREDVSVTFREASPRRVVDALARLPGVLAVEPLRVVPVALRHGVIERRTALLALPAGSELHRVVDQDLHVHRVPSSGLLLTSKLAEVLRVAPGDSLTVAVREGDRRTVRVAVADTVGELLGANVYGDLAFVEAMTGESGAISGALLSVDPRREGALYVTLKRQPALVGVGIRSAALAGFEKTIADSFQVSLGIAVIFAVVIAFGVVYNGARVALSERARELASLRVLGFTKREVTTMVFGEQTLLTVVGMLAGAGIGYALCAWVAAVGNTELFRIPLVVTAGAYLYAAAVIAGAFGVSALAMRGRIRALDIVACLKTGE